MREVRGTCMALRYVALQVLNIYRDSRGYINSCCQMGFGVCVVGLMF